MLKQIRKYQAVSMNKSVEPNLNATKGNSSGWIKHDDMNIFVLKLGSEIPVALFPTNEESKVHFSLFLFGVLIAESYLRGRLDQGYPREFSVELGHLCLLSNWNVASATEENSFMGLTYTHYYI